MCWTKKEILQHGHVAAYEMWSFIRGLKGGDLNEKRNSVTWTNGRLPEVVVYAEVSKIVSWMKKEILQHGQEAANEKWSLMRFLKYSELNENRNSIRIADMWPRLTRGGCFWEVSNIWPERKPKFGIVYIWGGRKGGVTVPEHWNFVWKNIINFCHVVGVILSDEPLVYVLNATRLAP